MRQVTWARDMVRALDRLVAIHPGLQNQRRRNQTPCNASVRCDLRDTRYPIMLTQTQQWQNPSSITSNLPHTGSVPPPYSTALPPSSLPTQVNQNNTAFLAYTQAMATPTALHPDSHLVFEPSVKAYDMHNAVADDINQHEQ